VAVVKLDFDALESDNHRHWWTLVHELLEPVGVAVLDAKSPDDGLPLRLRLAGESLRPGGVPEVDWEADESYELTVTSQEIVVSAPAQVGLLHGLRTLRQLVTPKGAIPCVTIKDTPRFAWRGLSLDLARHWFGPKTIWQVIDLAGHYKLRQLHLHLTDDQGWRLEIPSRTALAEISGRTQMNGSVPKGERGYLTMAEFGELQEYAAARFIEIIPEIDVPGHTNAATHACPELTPDGLGTPAYGGVEVGISRLWFDAPATEPWLRDVLGDVVTATRGRYVHIGGDEALPLDATEYVKLVNLAYDIVRQAGKRTVAWQEAVAADIGPEALLQYWDPRVKVAPFAAAATAGAQFIMSPASHAYLDMKYHAGYPLGQDWMNPIEVHDAYEWEPTALGVPPGAIAGVEACIFTEFIATGDEAFSMLLPRLPAIAEVAWTPPERRKWSEFHNRLAPHARLWNAEDYPWHASPQVAWLP